MSNLSGVSAYQQTNQAWNSQSATISEAIANKDTKATNKAEAPKEWKNVKSSSSLVPTKSDDYGMAIGDVKLSDKAKEYYKKLKDKFHGMEFIVVSKDMKSQVASKALSYGNSNKPVVLIDEEKVERMATDESFRKKYEGVIASSQTQLREMKAGIASTGASVKNYGMSVGDDGKASFFATLINNTKDVNKAQQERLAKKKAETAAAEKKVKKKEQAERIEQAKAESKEAAKEAEKAAKSVDESKYKGLPDDLDYYMAEDVAEYVIFEADSLDSLLSKLQKYAYTSHDSVKTEQELMLGQSIDFKG